MKNCYIIAGFAGLGKTTLEKKYNGVVDVESSYFKWLSDGIEYLTAEQRKGLANRKLNPAWPQNYIDEIKRLSKTNKVLLIYIGEEIRNLLEKENINFYIALPSKDSKQNLIDRLIKRGNQQSFIDGFSERFDQIPQKYKDVKQKVIYVKNGEYLEDALSREGILKGLSKK